MRGRTLYLVLLGTLIALYVAVQVWAPKPLDWSINLEHDGETPYGGEVLYTILPSWIGDGHLERVNRPPYLVLRDSAYVGTTYLLLTDDLAPDEAETERLLDYVARGNTLFLATQRLKGPLADTLGIDQASSFYGDSTLFLENPALAREAGYALAGAIGGLLYTLSDVDTARAVRLGTQRNEQGQRLTNFVRLDVGKGAIYLHTTPLAFANYSLLHADGAAYAAAALSYLPRQRTFWDMHYKPGRLQVATPMRYVLSQEALRWAYWLVVLGGLAFVLLRGRRWQRPIPVVEPPRSEMRAFVETVGRVYYAHGDHADLARRQLRFATDRLRRTLHLDDRETATLRRFDAEAAALLHHRAGVPLDTLEPLLNRLARLTRLRRAEDLLVLDQTLTALLDAVERGIAEVAPSSPD